MAKKIISNDSKFSKIAQALQFEKSRQTDKTIYGVALVSKEP